MLNTFNTVSVLLFVAICVSRSLVIVHASNNNNCPKERTFEGNGDIHIPLETISSYNVCLNTLHHNEKSSIIGVSLTATPFEDASKNISNSGVYVTIILDEKSDRSHGNSYTVAYSKTLSPNEVLEDHHISRTSHVRVRFHVVGNWTRNNFTLSFEEISFQTFTKNNSEVEETGIHPWESFEGRSYRPNSVYVFRILKSENVTDGNVRVAVKKLDVDVEMGEYLLIGSGGDPFDGPPPLFVASMSGEKTFLIKDEKAYVVFVSGSTRKNYSGFHITWEYLGDYEEKKKDYGNEDVLKSVPICFRNYSAVDNELKIQFERDRFRDLRVNFADFATKEKGLKVRSESVSIFYLSSSQSRGIVYARMKVTKNAEKGKAAFERQELDDLVSKYIVSLNESDTFQVVQCPIWKMDESWMSRTFYIVTLLPVICCLLVLLITWKHNPINKYFVKKKRIQRASQSEKNAMYYQGDCADAVQQVAENTYMTLPKLQVTNEYGRRYTLKLTDTLLGEELQSEDEIFNRMLFQKRCSDILDLQRAQMSQNLFSTERGEDNQGFELDEECGMDDKKQNSEEKTEHVYYSVKSRASSCDNDVSETKL